MQDAFLKAYAPWAAPVIIFLKIPDPLNPQKQPLCLVLDYWSPNASINATHKGNNIIFYFHLPNITDLLARL